MHGRLRYPWQPEPPAPVARPAPSSAWARAGEVLRSTALALAVTFSSLVAVVYASPGEVLQDAGGIMLIGLSMLVAVALGIGSVYRRRFPVALCVASTAAAVLLSMDTLAGLVGLSWVIARHPPRTSWWCGGMVGAATVLAVVRDASRPSAEQVFAVTDAATGQKVGPATAFYVVLVLACLGAAVAAGLLRRYREAAASAQRGRQHQAAVTEGLRTEILRQEERQRIAREVHDTLAGRLSAISLQAGVLEVTAGDGDSALRTAAQAIRASAHQAMNDLRGVIALLRGSGQGSVRVAGPGLGDLPALLDEVRAAGGVVNATVFVTDGGLAPAEISRAAYRIVQESLTNARKHATASAIQLDLRAAPGDGVRLRVGNAVGPTVAGDDRPAAGDGAGAAPGSGTGILGMQERAQALGGTLRAGVEGTDFVVVAELPWEIPGAAARASASDQERTG